MYGFRRALDALGLVPRRPTLNYRDVMAGLVPAIRVFDFSSRRTQPLRLAIAP